MPTYKYKCESCGVFDSFHSINEELKKCPTCGGKLKRMIVKPQIVFKQGAFYRKG